MCLCRNTFYLNIFILDISIDVFCLLQYSYVKVLFLFRYYCHITPLLSVHLLYSITVYVR